MTNAELIAAARDYVERNDKPLQTSHHSAWAHYITQLADALEAATATPDPPVDPEEVGGAFAAEMARMAPSLTPLLKAMEQDRRAAEQDFQRKREEFHERRLQSRQEYEERVRKMLERR